MNPILATVEHRPWPLPQRPWVMTQTWSDLLFAHWPVSAARLRPLVPASLLIDTFENQAWLAVTPFRLTGLRARLLPPLPGTSSFYEINVRTYVRLEDKPGVFFFSLDASSVAAVLGARVLYALPYFKARFDVRVQPDGVHYQSERTAAPPAAFEADYGPCSEPAAPVPGTLEHWLVERYCLYAVDRFGLYRAEIHHLPWPLQPAGAEIRRNTMAAAAGIELPSDAPLLHFAQHLKVYVWAPERVKAPVKEPRIAGSPAVA